MENFKKKIDEYFEQKIEEYRLNEEVTDIFSLSEYTKRAKVFLENFEKSISLDLGLSDEMDNAEEIKDYVIDKLNSVIKF